MWPGQLPDVLLGLLSGEEEGSRAEAGLGVRVRVRVMDMGMVIVGS